MSEPKYSDAIKSGLNLTWKHKNLWFYGFFISILGQFGIFDFLSKMVLAARGEVPTSLFWYFYSSFSGIKFSNIYLSVEQWSWLVWLGVFLLAFLISFIYIAIVSQGALIHNAAMFFDKKKIENSSKSWHHSRKYFWEVLFLNLIKKVLLFFIIMSLVLFLAKILFLNFWWTNLLFVLLFLLVCVLGSIISFLTIYAICYVVTDNKNFKEAILSSWNLFKKHWLVSLEVGLIMILANLFLFALVILGLYIFLIPSILIMLGLVFSINTFFVILVILLGAFLFAFYLIFISTLFNVFNISTWTFLFIKMRKDGIVSKVLSWFKK